MALRKELYRFKAALIIPVKLPVEEGVLPLLGISSPEPQNRIGGKITLGVSCPVPNETRVDLEWVVELDFDPDYPWRPRPQEGHLTLPPKPPYWIPMPLAVDIFLIQEISPTIVRLAHLSCCPEFELAYHQASPPQLISELSVEVANERIPLRAEGFKLPKLRMSPTPISKQQLSGLLARNTHTHDYFAALSDSIEARVSFFAALPTLVTSLEVAAYEHLGARNTKKGGTDPVEFHPRGYLAEAKPSVFSGKTFKDVDYDSYVLCEELWGSRHEVLHNGEGLIRTFNPTKNTTRGTPKRDFSYSEFQRFRKAVQLAIEWMEKA